MIPLPSDILVLLILLALLLVGAAFYLFDDSLGGGSGGSGWRKLFERGRSSSDGPPYDHNGEEPVRMIMATVGGKRVHVLHGLFSDDAITKYYVTFEISGSERESEVHGAGSVRDRWELNVSSDDYDQMADGDNGLLTYQGRTFLAFTRPPEL